MKKKDLKKIFIHILKNNINSFLLNNNKQKI